MGPDTAATAFTAPMMEDAGGRGPLSEAEAPPDGVPHEAAPARAAVVYHPGLPGELLNIIERPGR